MGSPEDIKKVVRFGRSTELAASHWLWQLQGSADPAINRNNKPARMLWCMRQDPPWKLREEEEDSEKPRDSFLLAALKAEPWS